MVHSLRLFSIPLVSASVWLFATSLAAQSPQGQWRDPFPTDTSSLSALPESLDLGSALRLVARANRNLRAGQFQRESAKWSIQQAGLRLNPEFDLESENVGGSFGGFSQSETSLKLSQEIELFGKRGARQEFAKAAYTLTDRQVAVQRFDLFVETKLRFYAARHAQRRVELAQLATQLAAEVVTSARARVQSGVVLVSELQLAELSQSRAALDLAQAESELISVKRQLAALWGENESLFRVTQSDTESVVAPALSRLSPLLGESRPVAELNAQLSLLEAELSLERSNARPNLTFGAGYKRLQGDRSNTFLVGVGLPLPLFNRNQGNISAVIARTSAAKLTREQALIEAETQLSASYRRFQQLRTSYGTIDTLILPKAEEVYNSIKRAYESGRVSYASLLEAERSVINHRSELNDIDLAIRLEMASIDQLLGVSLEQLSTQDRE